MYILHTYSRSYAYDSKMDVFLTAGVHDGRAGAFTAAHSRKKSCLCMYGNRAQKPTRQMGGSLNYCSQNEELCSHV